MKKGLQRGRLIILWSLAALLAMQLTASAQTLAHRYSFYSEDDSATNATDLVGTNNGTYGGDAVISGGQLQLDGDAWVQLQQGIVTNDLAVTVEAWGDFPPLSVQGGWANLFDFGTQDTNGQDSYSLSFSVNTDSPLNDLDAAISDFDNANVNRQNCYAPASLIAGGTGQYVAAVFNPPLGYIALYVNGTQVGKITGVTNTVTPGIRDVDNWIGKDNWPDPDMSANLDEFRVWNGALNGLEVAASCQNGFTNLNTNAGSILTVTVSAASPMVLGGLEPASVVATATLITNTADITPLATYSSGNTNVITVDPTGTLHGVGLGSALITASFGGLSNSVTVSVIEAVSVLTHRISFSTPVSSSNTVADSVGTLYATLEGDAVESNGVAIIDGTVGTYIDLSSNSFANDGIISGYTSATVDFWAAFGTLTAWNYAWSFGTEPSGGGGIDYLYFAANNGGGNPEINENGTAFNSTGNFSDSSVHCTTVFDPSTGIMALYTNGVLSASLTDDYTPLNYIATNYIYFGRSLWTDLDAPFSGDPFLPTNSSFQEIRVYNGALTPEQIAMAQISGPDNTNINPGSLQSLSLQAPSTVQWLQAAHLILLANYTSLSNFDILGNSVITPLGLTISSSDPSVLAVSGTRVNAVGLGAATVTVSYSGITNSVSINVVRPPPPILTHRYSFISGTANDSVGTDNGTLMGNATLAGGQLVIPNTSQAAPGTDFLQLPDGILTNSVNGIGTNFNDPSVTIETWATFGPSQGYWAALFDFGYQDPNDNAAYDIHFGQLGGNDIIGISDTDNANGDNDSISTGSVAGLTNAHIVCVFNPPAGYEAVYTNGVMAGIDTSVTISMAGVWGVSNKIGSDLWPDPGMQGSVSEFRIYNGVLTPDQVAADFLAGPNQLPTPGVSLTASTVALTAGSLTISWPVSGTTGYSLYSSPTIGPSAVWTLVSTTPTQVGQNYQVTVSASGGASQFYVLKN
jgi:hypothetical protein